MAETEEQIKARKERERDELYALDISGVEWQSAPGTEEHEERVEIAYLPGGAVAMRSSLDHSTVLRYTEAEWRGVVVGVRGGGVEPRGGGGRLKIRVAREEETLCLVVSDDGVGMAITPQEGVGLANTRARLRELYGGAASLAWKSEDGTQVEIRLPWHTA